MVEFTTADITTIISALVMLVGAVLVFTPQTGQRIKMLGSALICFGLAGVLLANFSNIVESLTEAYYRVGQY